MQVAIMLYPGFTALDFIGPHECLRWWPDTEVRLVWHEPGPIAADSGVLLVGATHSFDETPSPDVILIPGGFSTMEHARDEKVLDWVRTAHQASTWTASVCSGSVILAAAGLLEGKRATSHWAAVQMLRTFGAVPVDDDRIVPGRIGGDAKAKAIQLSMEYDPQPPFDSGHMSKASASTKAAAVALMGKELAKPAALAATTGLLWDTALQRVRSRRVRRRTPANR